MEKYCISCGEPTVPGNRFCLSCGASLENNDEEELKIEEKVEKEISKPEKKIKNKKKKKKSFLKVVLIIISIIVVLFIALAIFLINSLDTSFTAAEFKGNYSGEIYFEEIEYGKGENPEDLLAVVSEFELPIKVRIIEDEISDGVFIILNPQTLEEKSRIIFGGEYDQIFGDYEDENGNMEYIQAIVNQKNDKTIITGHHEYNSFDNSVKVVYKFEIVKQDELNVEDFSGLYERFNTAINEYFDSLIEDNTDAEEEFSYTGTEEIYGYYPVNIVGQEETGYIIFSQGQAPESTFLPPVSFDLEGWAYVVLGEEPVIIQYIDKKNIYSINRYIETEAEEFYINGARDIVKVISSEYIEVDADGIYWPEYIIEVQSELPLNDYVDDLLVIFTSKIEEGKLIGDITINNIQTEETYTIEFEGK